jgi:hypothetical protein
LCLRSLLCPHFSPCTHGLRLRTGRSLDLLPKMLSLIPSDAELGEGQSGRDFKDLFLNRLCSRPWPLEAVVHLANTFREIPLTDEQYRFVVDKIVGLLPRLEVERLPPLVYKLLLLCTKVRVECVLCCERALRLKPAARAKKARSLKAFLRTWTTSTRSASSTVIHQAQVQPLPLPSRPPRPRVQAAAAAARRA